VTIVLLDENDNSPQFTTSKYQGKVFGNQTTGMQVVKVTIQYFVESFNRFPAQSIFEYISGNYGTIMSL